MLKTAPAMKLIIAGAVWDRMLLGMWKGSALPVERGIRVKNALGDWMPATPVQNIHFPFDNRTLPDTFASPAWGALQEPMGDSESLCNTWPCPLVRFCCSTDSLGPFHALLQLGEPCHITSMT